MIRLFILLGSCVFCLMPGGHCSHIVGGGMRYECLEDDGLYRIHLTLYRDCTGFFGFDNPATIGFFKGDGSYSNFFGNPISTPIMELPPIVFDSCISIPQEACIETVSYGQNRYFNFDSSGYYFVYQRCCRSSLVNNIQNPIQQGATVSAYMSGESMLLCNNSAYFDKLPPNFFCVNEPIFLDHSAVDSEGDSIVYELCAPLSMADISDSTPVPPAPPPYPPVQWQPPYSLNNPLGGIPLTIDPQTGLITGTPNASGQFVVGVCASEYRDGVLLSRITRDFVYFVGPCMQTIVADFETEVDCDGLSITTDNDSFGAGTYSWDFGAANGGSNDIQPPFSYSQDGSYDITLIAEPGDMCADTLTKNISVERACGLNEEGRFEISAEENFLCSGEKTQLSVPYCEGYSYSWWPEPELSAADVHNPVVSPLVGTVYTVEVMREDSCLWSSSIPIHVADVCDVPVLVYPNAFTPNADGLNDNFGLITEFNFTSYDFKVYSRWGELVFHSSNPNERWDGIFESESLPQDVYVWVASYSYQHRDGLREGRDSGDVALLR